MVNNFLCSACSKEPICKIVDLIFKFHEEAKKPLGVNLTMNSCSHYDEDAPIEG